MIECDKRQREFHNSELKHRCLEQRAGTYLEIVSESTCANCPIYRPNRLPVIEDSKYPPCQFRSHYGGTMCQASGLPTNPDACNKCVKITTDTLTFTDKVKNYASAVQKWVANGRPTRTEEEVKEIFENHCSKCNLYDREKESCNSCGCAVNTKDFPLVNKIKMKTEVCPLGQW
jgi:hypothetical protein